MNLLDSISVVKPTLVIGPYGSDQTDWAGAVPVASAAVVEPLSVAERAVNGNRVATRLKCFVPASVDVDAATDKVIWRDDEYQVDGVETFYAQGQPHHKTIILSRVEGG